MRPPTGRQLEVLRAVHRSLVERGLPPTLQELCAAFGWSSTNAAGCHVQSLRAKGLLEGDHMTARALRLTEAGLRAIGAFPCVVRQVLPERRCQSCGAAYFGRRCPLCPTPPAGPAGATTPRAGVPLAQRSP